MALLMKQPFCLDDIRAAEQRIKGITNVTPVMTSRRMDAKAGTNLFFKCELLQRTGSFKFRGAVNFLSKLKEESKGKTLPCVTTHSSGNFAQGLALAAQILGFKAYVVMPDVAPECKQDAVKEYGAELVLCQSTEQGRIDAKDAVVKEKGALYISTSQDHVIMAGQATICTELLQQTDNKLDAIVVPVGGGGMLAGALVAAKSLCPGIRVIAAEPELANDCYQSFVAKKHIRQSHFPSTVADGLRISVGNVAWPIIRDLVDDVITVTEDEIKEGTRLVWKNMKLCIEPSAGVGVAAIMSENFKSKYGDLKNVGVILCGGNYDIDAVKTWI
ncbi:serine racemase-like [Asterias rubens]|uniref:serine racemase-like n=1 Tax=Asterias rubens TaxID=7604 RepID=UPI001455A0C3|nr:serine racemase-like [Asterias rubens]XP_033628371.1 serine racemase-like [Asterias rubens]XP_033628372.1 serine racemase-like [Asterias rubens]